MTKTQTSTPKRVTTKDVVSPYGIGCQDGYRLAEEWMNSPNHGCEGGTLQAVILDLAERFSKARGEDRARVRGEIVGFSLGLERPDVAAQYYARYDNTFQRFIARAVGASAG